MIEILAVCFAVMFASLSGVVTVFGGAQKFIKNSIHLLTSFAIGVFGVVVFFLISETLSNGTLGQTALWVFAGLGMMFLLPEFIPDFHHHHTDDSEHTHSSKGAVRILASDGVHNIADGILISASFLSGGAVSVGVILSVLIHEVVQELTEFFVLRQAGYSTKRALVRNFLVSSTILIGAVGSYFFLERFESLEPVFLGVAAGGFLAVLLQDLIPSSFGEARRSKKALSHIVAIILGLLLMLGVGLLFGHGV